jgi:hypothetical protein
MKRIAPVAIATGVLACALVGIASVLVASVLLSSKQARVPQLLGLSQPADKVQLFAPGHEIVSSHTYLKTLGVDSRPFTRQQLSSGHTLDIYMRPDQTVEYKLEWYDPPSASVKRLKEATVYGADGKTPMGQAAFRLNGSRELRAVRLENGNYQTVNYYENGQSPAEMRLMGRSYETWDTDPVLLSATRWSKEGVVTYTNLLNKDMSRDVVVFDDSHHPVKVMHIGKFNADSTVVVYVPGTEQVRVKAKTGYSEVGADFFRADGTKEMSAHLWSNSAFIDVFDKTGKQLWQTTINYDRVVVNGIGRMSAPYLVTVRDFDADGKLAHEWTWRFGTSTIQSYEEYNVKVANPDPKGEPILCNRVRYYYRPDGSLENIHFSPTDDKRFKDWDVKVPQTDNVRPPMPPAAQMIIPDLDPDLPIPEPDRGGG